MSDVLIGPIINGLLTGGILIGKICQAIGGAGAKRFTDPESGFTVSGDVSTGGVKFFRSDVSGSPLVYAFNPDTSSDAVVTIPNESGANGVQYQIKPTEKIAIGEVDSPLVSPTVNVTAGLVNLPSTSSNILPGKPSMLRLAFSNLSFGKVVTVGSFKLSCTTTQLLIISTSLTASFLSYFFIRSDKGVSATNQNRLPPAKIPRADDGSAENDQSFDVDFKSLGINVEDDILSGDLGLEVNVPLGARISEMSSEPLHEVEIDFFARLARNEL